MKNTYIALIVLIVLVGGFIWWANSRDAAVPVSNQEGQLSGEVTSPMPAPGSENVPEMIVSPDGEAAVKEFTVEGKNFSFSPAALGVSKGDRVKITFKNTQGFHDFMIEGYGVATKQGQAPFEEVIEFTADKAGTFQYYCSVGEHRAMGMVGTLTVAE